MRLDPNRVLALTGFGLTDRAIVALRACAAAVSRVPKDRQHRPLVDRWCPQRLRPLGEVCAA